MSAGDKYSFMNDLSTFGFFANATENRGRGDGDMGAGFPRSDAEDLSRGCRFIPGEVTMARRRGERVDFVGTRCGPCCWYWQMPDGSRIYHFERSAYDYIKQVNHVTDEKSLAGPCPNCGNQHTNGGHVKAEDIKP